MYGVAEWAMNFGPELFDLSCDDLQHLNDDRVGRCLDNMFQALDTWLIMDIVTHSAMTELTDLGARLSSLRTRFDLNQDLPILKTVAGPNKLIAGGRRE